MIKCIAIDDESLALKLLVDNIKRVPYLQLTAACDDALQAAKVLSETEVDLIFIDIEMPGLSGLQFIESMSNKPMVIMVTAYKNYALQGFELDVVDYLVKPVPFGRFFKACNKAQSLYRLTKQTKGKDHIFVNEGYSMRKIMLADIAWVEGSSEYIYIHLASNTKPFLIRMTLKSIEEQLPVDNFIRIHRSYIVSKNAITAVRKNSIFIGEDEFSIGETFKSSVLSLIYPNE